MMRITYGSESQHKNICTKKFSAFFFFFFVSTKLVLRSYGTCKNSFFLKFHFILRTNWVRRIHVFPTVTRTCFVKMQNFSSGKPKWQTAKHRRILGKNEKIHKQNCRYRRYRCIRCVNENITDIFPRIHPNFELRNPVVGILPLSNLDWKHIYWTFKCFLPIPNVKGYLSITICL